jgi:hypothetical protein
MFYAFVEFDGPWGRFRQARGFTTAVLRDAWLSEQAPAPDEEWSDCETWEASEGWDHIPILA